MAEMDLLCCCFPCKRVQNTVNYRSRHPFSKHATDLCVVKLLKFFGLVCFFIAQKLLICSKNSEKVGCYTLLIYLFISESVLKWAFDASAI